MLPENKRRDVTQLMTEVNELERKLRKEENQPVSHAERAKRGNVVTQWWERLNGWFRTGS